MLITTDTQTNATQAWERIQQPVHSSNQQPETLRLLAALDEGWQILEAANYLARGQNAEFLWLEVRVGNTRARQVYERHGFRQVGQRKNYYASGHGQREDALVMNLRLA